MANKFRSSFDIKLNGVDYTLRPSFEAIMAFNDKAGMDISEAMRGYTEKGLSVKTAAAAIWAGIYGEAKIQPQAGHAPSFEKIGNECQAHGFADCMGFAIEFLSKAMASDESIKKYEEGLASPQEN